MPEKFNKNQENYIYEDTIDDYVDYSSDELIDSDNEQLPEVKSSSHEDLDLLADRARNIAEGYSYDDSKEATGDQREKLKQSISELMNNVGDNGMKQIELLAHSSERLNGFRAVIETGFDPSEDIIKNEVDAIRNMVLEKQTLTKQDHDTYSGTYDLIQDSETKNVLTGKSTEDYTSDLGGIKESINDEAAIRDRELIDLIDAIPSKGDASTITGAMEKAIDALRSRGSGFPDSSTAKLMTLLQSISKEAAG